MFRNIDAVQQLSKLTKTALGPHGKYIINLNFRLLFPLFFVQKSNLYFLSRYEQNGYQPFGKNFRYL